LIWRPAASLCRKVIEKLGGESPFLAPNEPTVPVLRCPLIAVERKWLADGRNDANDPEGTSQGSFSTRAF
jgi:hypothetical protein